MSLIQSIVQKESPFLREMLSQPLEFGPSYTKTSFAPTKGVREVKPGPPSPPQRFSDINAEAGPSSIPLASFIGPIPPSPTRIPTPTKSTSTPNGHKSNGVVRTTTPSPKGKSREDELYEPITDLSWPELLRDRKVPPAGLNNPSMACYANATLQVLLHTPPLLSIAENHSSSSCILSRKQQFCMLCVLRDLPHWTMRRYNPREVHTNLGQIKKGFNRNRQEDSHEFFRFVTDAFQNTALAGLPKSLSNATKHTTWIHRIWGGRVRSRVVCSRCLKPSDTFDYFLDLSLDCHQSKKSLGQMLQSYVKEDRLEGDNAYHCENCKAKAVATKSFRIADAPPILTFHLKRFSVNYNAYNGRARADKFTQYIEFPEYLDIAPYMIDHETSSPYRLFGVTCHRGAELRYGHYTSYVRGPSGKWWNADDDDVSAVDINDVLRDRTAYLLSYARIDKLPPGHIVVSNGTPKATGNWKTTNGHMSTPPNGNHHQYTSTISNHKPLINGHGSSKSTASAAIADLLPNSPSKRKREQDDDSDPSRSPSPSPTRDRLGNSDSFNYRNPTPEDRFYKTQGPRHDRPSPYMNGHRNSPKLTKSQKKKEAKRRKKEKTRGIGVGGGGGAPMPFNHGRSNGMKGLQSRVDRMQGRK